MQLRLTLAAVAAIAASVAIGVLSCSAGGGGVGGGLSGSGGSGTFVGSTGASCSMPTCSSDLHDVVCDGNVVQHCPSGKACGNGGCVSPCEGAEDNKSSIGCDYYSVDPDSITAVQGACFAAYIANTWDTPVQITVDRAGMPLDISHSVFTPSGSGEALTYAPLSGGMLPVGQVAIVFLSRSPPPDPSATSSIACPAGVTPATVIDPAVHGTGYGDAFHISTSAPVVAYDIFPYGGGAAAATSATLLLPTSAWDTNYIAVSAYPDSLSQPTLAIVAQEDNTTVTILPSAAIAGGSAGGMTVAPAAAGTAVSYPVKKGQILEFTQIPELSGSIIKSDKPIGVWGGDTCLTVPTGQSACDAAHQQIPPIKALGSEYAGVKYRDRYAGVVETPPWRIIGAVDGTVLTWDPAPPSGAPTMVNAGQVATLFNSAGPFIVKSQDNAHPFYMSAYMEGCTKYAQGDAQLTDCRGDPEFVNVVPPEQYLNDYVFFTDPTYPETDLVLVRKKTKGGDFADVTLDCSGTVMGWQQLDTAGEYQYTHVDLVTGNFMQVNGCDNGRHEIKSTAAFGLTVWGWGSGITCNDTCDAIGQAGYTQYVSYAYPAGASVKPINQVVVVPVPK